jgi:hypothetical protein
MLIKSAQMSALNSWPEPRKSVADSTILQQGDQIKRIFAHRAIVYYGQFYLLKY